MLRVCTMSTQEMEVNVCNLMARGQCHPRTEVANTGNEACGLIPAIPTQAATPHSDRVGFAALPQRRKCRTDAFLHHIECMHVKADPELFRDRKTGTR